MRYVDRKARSESALHLYRLGIAYLRAEPVVHLANPNGYFPEYRYPRDFGGVDVYRVESGGYRGSLDHAL